MAQTFEDWKAVVRDELFRQGNMTLVGANDLLASISNDDLRHGYEMGFSPEDFVENFWDE
jgi:hypothetical protein